MASQTHGISYWWELTQREWARFADACWSASARLSQDPRFADDLLPSTLKGPCRTARGASPPSPVGFDSEGGALHRAAEEHPLAFCLFHAGRDTNPFVAELRRTSPAPLPGRMGCSDPLPGARYAHPRLCIFCPSGARHSRMIRLRRATETNAETSSPVRGENSQHRLGVKPRRRAR